MCVCVCVSSRKMKKFRTLIHALYDYKVKHAPRSVCVSTNYTGCVESNDQQLLLWFRLLQLSLFDLGKCVYLFSIQF